MFLETSAKLRTDVYNGCSTEETGVKEMGENTDRMEMLVLQHETL